MATRLSPMIAVVLMLAGASARGELHGEYGFISSSALGPAPEGEIRARVTVMALEYGIREFLFYDWFADYSTPVRGETWNDAFFRSHVISVETLRTAIDEVHRQGGRAWAYVQAVAAEEQDLEAPTNDIWKLRGGDGAWYWHPPPPKAPRFPTYFANGAWARVMVARWAPDVKGLGFDGIHWDTLGPIAGDAGAEALGFRAFLTTAQELLAERGLRQTMNFVEMHWWDPQLVRATCAFPYAEVWFHESERRYYAAMDAPEMGGVRGVMAMYPRVQKGDWTETRIIAARRAEARKHNLVYVIVGDGERRMQHEYWPDTVPLTEEEKALLRAGALVPALSEVEGPSARGD